MKLDIQSGTEQEADGSQLQSARPIPPADCLVDLSVPQIIKQLPNVLLFLDFTRAVSCRVPLN